MCLSNITQRKFYEKSSPVAIRTQDLLLRRQLLYPAELRDQRKTLQKLFALSG